jgi:hypothetical protein
VNNIENLTFACGKEGLVQPFSVYEKSFLGGEIDNVLQVRFISICLSCHLQSVAHMYG